MEGSEGRRPSKGGASRSRRPSLSESKSGKLLLATPREKGTRHRRSLSQILFGDEAVSQTPQASPPKTTSPNEGGATSVAVKDLRKMLKHPSGSDLRGAIDSFATHMLSMYGSSSGSQGDAARDSMINRTVGFIADAQKQAAACFGRDPALCACHQCLGRML